VVIVRRCAHFNTYRPIYHHCGTHKKFIVPREWHGNKGHVPDQKAHAMGLFVVCINNKDNAL